METGKTLGILGGTFDPIHNGHLLAAEWAREAFKLDDLIFIPAARPPHKDLGGVLDSQHRYRMVELAVKDNPNFSVSAIELERAGYSYTVDTITHYLQAYPGVEIFFIIGIDALQLIYTWKDLDQLLALCKFIVVTRPGYQLDKNDPCFQSVPAAIWERVELLAIPALEISSSDIRRRVAHGQSIRYLLPFLVEEYIRDNKLYRDIMVNNMNESQIVNILSNRLSSRRLQHCLEVARVAREMAENYGIDPDKAYTTGLLHDYAKGMAGSELLAIARSQFLLEDEVESRIPDLLHASVGAYLLKTELGVDDEEILQAVKVHTLGALEMSTLDKIIFLADMIEPGRDFPGLERLQCLAGQDLDRAMLFGLDSTIRYCMEQGRILHPLTIRVRNNFLNNIKE